MQLVIAEKPSVARDLARVLGVRPGGKQYFESDRYVITWCIGHLVELEEPAAYDGRWKAWRLELLPMLPESFLLRPARHAIAQLRAVSKLLRERRFVHVINACDAGREGELIFRYVYQHANSRLPIRRLWISSLTDDAIRRGIASLRSGADYAALADAARSRSEADWLVGMNATRAITVRGRSAGHDMLFSIGRVQTPTLAMLVAREREIREFVPRPYWEVRGDFRTADGATFQALWRHDKAARLASADVAEQIAARDRVHGAATDPDGPVVERLRARTVHEAAPQLFDLTSLQRTANRRFGFSAARTLEVAQALYERHKVVTYPRTDSRHLSTDVARELHPLFEALAEVPDYAPFARRLVEHPPRPSRRVVDDSKVHDHHAIIPTGNQIRLASLERDEARLLDLIVRRFLGVFFPDAEFAVTEAWIRVVTARGEPPAFAPTDRELVLDAAPPPPDRYLARGRARIVAGWQEVAGIDPSARDDRPRDDQTSTRDHDREPEPTAALPVLVEGQRLDGRFSTLAKQTTPPPRYTEATLLAAMESAGKAIDDETLRAAMKDCGLGTPATRAAIIETLLRRQYIVRERQSLVPTPAGIGLIESIPVASLASAELTGTWEARLARIARGEDSRAAFMADIARYVTEIIDAIRSSSPPAAPAGGVMHMPRGGSQFHERTPQRHGKRRGQGTRTAARSPATRSRKSATRPAPSAPRAVSRPAPNPRATGSEAARGADADPRITRENHTVAARDAGSDPRITRENHTKAASPPDVAALALTCPRCKAATLITGSRGWGCARWREGCGFVVWFETAGRRLTPTQLRELITRGKTRKARFVDENGVAIDGRLVLDPAIRGGARLEPAGE